ncbi:MAG: RNA-binding protein [Candidatus Altiarchaeota archaeon]|nr:RNA-binding protein [Candidatus Altiarchaeota archaeon]
MTELAGNRSLVTPGEILSKGMESLPGFGTFRDGDFIRASFLGLSDIKGRLVNVIPLSGKYIPKKDDPIIGIVKDVRFSNWEIEINSPYTAVMMISEASNGYIDTNREPLSKYFDVGDTVLCKIKNVEENMNIHVTVRAPGMRKLNDGKVIEVKSSKIPRIIGKSASMVKMIKEYTGSNVFVGQNGRVWVSGGNEALAIKVIKTIEQQAHTSGLTDKIKTILEAEGDGRRKTEISD